jgi:ABC-type cobalamin/Fe3+-siderophores transport system ATPase subunit
MAIITRVLVKNFKTLRSLDLELTPDLNVVVGNNDSGKSTVLQAIALGLTSRLNGRHLSQELSPYLINSDATAEYVASLQKNPKALPPEVIIEVFLEDTPDVADLRGLNNLLGINAPGVRLSASMSPAFMAEYEKLVADPSTVRLAPTEYYTVEWVGFSGNAVTSRSIPARVSIIDASTLRLQAGIDQHLQQSISDCLEVSERVELSRQYRSLKEEFGSRTPVQAINIKLQAESSGLSSRPVSLAIDLSQRSTWESSIVAHLADIPVALAGKGEQNVLKILLALKHSATNSHIVLVEEPEAHLSFSLLNQLMNRVVQRAGGKQIVATTHSTFVANKLGLENLVLLGGKSPLRMANLKRDTARFFRKLSGYDTLRLVLAQGVFLVEGPSDELIVQRAFFNAHGKLPIEAGFDVISVGLAHKRFLELALHLGKKVRIVVDNDGVSLADVQARYKEFTSPSITLHTPDDPALNSLEPALVEANSIDALNAVLKKAFKTKPDVRKYMENNKTEAALAVFESDANLAMPAYIESAVAI